MKKMTLAAALSLAAMLPFAATTAFAETAETQKSLCAESPAAAAKAGIDCAATSAIGGDDKAAAQQYPDGPVNFGNGIIF